MVYLIKLTQTKTMILQWGLEKIEAIQTPEFYKTNWGTLHETAIRGLIFIWLLAHGTTNGRLADWLSNLHENMTQYRTKIPPIRDKKLESGNLNHRITSIGPFFLSSLSNFPLYSIKALHYLWIYRYARDYFSGVPHTLLLSSTDHWSYYNISIRSSRFHIFWIISWYIHGSFKSFESPQPPLARCSSYFLHGLLIAFSVPWKLCM